MHAGQRRHDVDNRQKTCNGRSSSSPCPSSTRRKQKQDQRGSVSAKMTLSSLCNSNDWDATLEWITNNPADAAAQTLDSNNKSTTILHKILTSRIIDPKSRLAIVKEILRVAPNAASVRNHHASLPLHVAARNNLKMDGQTKERFMSALIKAFPAALTTQDAVKHTPLHIACDKWCSCRDAKFLIDAAPEAATMKDEKGLLPIHIACTRRCSPDKLRFLLDAYPDGVEAVSNDGSTPLSIATASATPKHPNSALIRMLNEAIQDRQKYGLQERRKRSASDQPPCIPTESNWARSSATDHSEKRGSIRRAEAALSGADEEECMVKRPRLNEGDDASGTKQNERRHRRADPMAWEHNNYEQVALLAHNSQEPLTLAATYAGNSSRDAAAGALSIQAHQQQLLERGRLAGVLPPRDMLRSLGQQALWIVAQTHMNLPPVIWLQLQHQQEVIISEMSHRYHIQKLHLEQIRRDTDRLRRENKELKEREQQRRDL